MKSIFQIIYECIINYWLLFVFALIIIYTIYDYYSFKSLLEKTGKKYCIENNFNYIGIKHAKAHFSVIYKNQDSGKRKYKKFRMNAFLGKVKYLEWLN